MYLGGDRDQKNRRKNQGANQVAEIHRHRDRIAAGLAQGGAEDLDDPEDESDFGNLAKQNFARRIGALCSRCHYQILKEPLEAECVHAIDGISLSKVALT
jgi:hypothetical protein